MAQLGSNSLNRIPHSMSSQGSQESASSKCKRPRLQPLLHGSFTQSAIPLIDRLQKLYPHPRDSDCHLDDKLHQYQVLGQPYSLSVSGWWQKYFEEFNPTRTSASIVKRHLENPGFRIAPSGQVTENIVMSSVYNFAQHIRVLEGRGDKHFLSALRSVAQTAIHDYARRQNSCPYSIQFIMEQGRQYLMSPQKPQGLSCYYLMLLATNECGPEKQASHITRTWQIHGGLEALKGTYMHKKIELFINAMAASMERDGSFAIAVEDLLCEQLPAHEYAAVAVLRQIAWSQDPELWNHPLAQRFFESELQGESIEFQKFRSWLSTKRRWSPYRVEWSIYNEDLKVAGQIDSLWMDLDAENALVMADWKRARELLTDDIAELERRSFGNAGNSLCSHLYDVAWSHYFVQQTLYAYLLASKYGVTVHKMILVQCHPHVGGSDFIEAPLVPDFELAESMATSRSIEMVRNMHANDAHDMQSAYL